MKLSEFMNEYGDLDINEKDLKEKLGIKFKAWQPEEDDKYYFTTDHCEIRDSFWKNNICHKNRYELGNCFKTKEEAERVVEKLKIAVKLKRFAIENNECEIDWNDRDQDKWFLYYDYNCKKVDVDCLDQLCKRSDVHFTSKKLAEQAIEYIGADRLKKYYFEVEE